MQSIGKLVRVPKEKHIPDDAGRTSVCFTAEDRAAIRWIAEIRRHNKDKRRTINDIVVDALWYFLEKTEGKTREEIRATVPPLKSIKPPMSANVTQMPNPKKK